MAETTYHLQENEKKKCRRNGEDSKGPPGFPVKHRRRENDRDLIRHYVVTRQNSVNGYAIVCLCSQDVRALLARGRHEPLKLAQKSGSVAYLSRGVTEGSRYRPMNDARGIIAVRKLCEGTTFDEMAKGADSQCECSKVIT